MAIGPIPFSEIVLYLSILPNPDFDYWDCVDLIQAADGAYIETVNDKAKKETEQNGKRITGKNRRRPGKG